MSLLLKPVGIHGYAMSCALGSNPSGIWSAASAGSTAGLVTDDDFLFEGSTHLGRMNTVKPKEIDPFFDCRVNQVLADVCNQLDLNNLAAFNQVEPHRVGVIVGTSTSGVDEFEAGLQHYDQYQKWAEDYQFHHQRMANVSEFLATHIGAQGPVMSVSTACSSSAKVMLSAQRWLETGLCDVVVVGGVDILCQLTVNGFNALGALSSQRCLPFSINRTGINIGEAAALFVLSSKTSDINFLGGGESSDAHHISAPDPSGKGAITAMQRALEQAQVSADEIDYINLHGTGTPQNDLMEAKAVNHLFKAKKVKCSSTKSLTGHTLGAAGAIEAGLCALSMSAHNQSQQYLPHVYDEQYDTAMEPLNLVKPGQQDGKPELVLSNSFAFGGSNASIILGTQHFAQRHD